MSNTILAVRKSVVMLFSFALIATLLTIINVGVNESGNNSLSTVTSAKADAGIGYGGDLGGIAPPPSIGGCGAGCTKTGTSGQGGGVGVVNPLVRNTFYSCIGAGGGQCNVSNVVTRDAAIRHTYCVMTMARNGYIVTTNGNAAVQYLKANLVGNVWKPWGSAERMFRHLTGRDLGWFPYPIAWSDVSNIYYNGTGAAQTEGELSFYCQQVAWTEYKYETKNTVCYPKYDGRPFPYAVGYSVTYSNVNSGAVLGTASKDWVVTGETCVYVNASTPPPKIATQVYTCYWNINHNGFFSTNKSAILNGGTPTTNKPVSPSQNAVAPYISGADSTSALQNCTTQISMQANLSLSDGYAYYRLQGQASYRQYQYYIWDTSYTGGASVHAGIVALGSGVANRQVYGTHSCATNPPYMQYPSWGSLPNISFKYSDCGRNTDWKCTIPYAPRINGATNNVEVMRDGNYLRTDLGGVSISGSGVRDISTKQVGTVADSNMSYMVNVIGGSSPFNGTNANDTKQYFQLWKGDKETKTLWGSWITQPNANKTSFLNFYWSSDNGTKWQMNYQAKMNTAEFSVPFQNGTLEPAGRKWMPDANIDCDGVKTSNAATVLRSVSSEG